MRSSFVLPQGQSPLGLPITPDARTKMWFVLIMGAEL